MNGKQKEFKMSHSITAKCHVCDQRFDYKKININYNSICPSCLEKNPHIMQKINQVYQEYYETVDEAREKFDKADEQADEVLNMKLEFILEVAK